MDLSLQITHEFLHIYACMLKKLKYHDFIAKAQATFMRERISNQVNGEYHVIADFSALLCKMKYRAFTGITTKQQYIPSCATGQLSNLCFIVSADSREQDTIVVHLFQRKLVEFVTIHSGEKPKRICYMSDGCAALYKNWKNFLNLCNYFAHFGVQAEWHLFAKSHGKSVEDGAGGTLKTLATKASLLRTYSGHIRTPHLQERLKHSSIFDGTHQIHCAKLISADIMEVSLFPPAVIPDVHEKTTIIHHESHIQIVAITGYVNNGSCWLGYAKSLNHLEQTVTVMFLHPCIPSPSFIYPSLHDIMNVDPSDINPITATGRTYTLTKKQIPEATRLLAASRKSTLLNLFYAV